MATASPEKKEEGKAKGIPSKDGVVPALRPYSDGPGPLTREGLAEAIQGELLLAPLTKGGNLPFRRLCIDFGAKVTVGEMAYARFLVKGAKKERALMNRAFNEQCFGVQVATKQIDEGIRAAEVAAECGAQWIDLNCGCPIYDATRRGLGAKLLKSPRKLGRLVEGIAAASPLPLSVKVRTGAGDKVNLLDNVRALQDAGAAAITVHGRTMDQRYKNAADWDIIAAAAANLDIPLIGLFLW